MTLALVGAMALPGFEHAWFLLFLIAFLGVIGLCIVVQLARQRRMLRFANMELLESVAPKRPSRWRHVPAILLVLSLLLFTIAMAGPTHDVRIPRNRAVVMLVIDVSQSMRATDVSPSRLAAAQDAAKQFAGQLTPGINLGLIAFAGTATVLVSPTTNRDATKTAIDKLQLAELSGGDSYNASSLEQLKQVFTNLQQQIGYETIKGDASVGWLRLGAVVLALAALAALLINRRLPN